LSRPPREESEAISREPLRSPSSKGIAMYVRKTKSGKYQVTVNHRGQVRTATAPTRAEAIQKGADLVVDLGGNPGRLADHITVAVVLADHATANTERWSPQYAADFARITARLPAEFLEQRASNVTASDIAALYTRLARTGTSPHRLQRLHGFLSGAFRRAAVHGWVRLNPATGVTPTPPAPADLVVPTSSQVAALVAAAPPGPQRMFMRLAAITGARRGELVGLQWDDVDAARCEVTIRRARSLDGTGRPFTSVGKTGRRGHRVLALDPATVAMLIVERDRQHELAEANLMDPPVWLFSHDGGSTPWPPDYGTEVFNTARTAAKIAGVRLHDLRHHVATSMLQDGESPIDVAGQLGDTVQTVLRTYAHFLPGRGRDAALRRAAALG
jgi:integrase